MRETTLDQLGPIVTGKTPPTSRSEFFGGNIPFVTPSDMDGRRVIVSTKRSLTDAGARSVSARIPVSAIMVSCIGSDMGKASIAGRECVTNQQINSLIVKGDEDPLFVYYNLSARRLEIKGVAAGSAQPILKKSAFGRLKIHLPPPALQRTIAQILGALDDKIELNRRMAATLEEMARATFKSWFIDFDPVRAKSENRPTNLPSEIDALFPDSLKDSELGPIPAGWRATVFGEVSSVFDSKRVPLSSRERAARQGQYPYYGATSIMDCVDEYLFDGIYLLMGEDGSVINPDGTPFLQYVWGKFWVNNHAHVIQGSNGISTEHLLIHLKHSNIGPFITGAVQLKLNQGNMNRIPFIHPGNAIASLFAGQIQGFFDRIRLLTDETESLEQIRDCLLPKLISGELTIRHRNASQDINSV